MASLLGRIARRLPVAGPRRIAAAARQRFRDEAAAALGGLSGPEHPILLGYFPRFRTNPYQRLLYLAAAQHGIAAVGMERAEAIDALTELQRSGTATILHLHWLTPVLAGAASEAEGGRRIDAFVKRLEAYTATGGRVAWTVHNVLPHESRWEALEIRLCREVAERAAIVHVMAAETAAAVAPYYMLAADRTLHVPHPSYTGAYPTTETRASARRSLGLAEDDRVFLAFGAIRRYKGLDRLLEAWRTLPPDPARRLVVAGAPLDEPELAALLGALRAEPGITVDARKIPDDELPRYLLAADVAVLPYRRALNSGALLLFLTFGLPVIVPADRAFAELVDPSFAVTFDPDAPGSLGAALQRAPALVTPEARAAAAAMAARFDPASLSSRFAVELRRRVEAVSTPAPPQRS